LQIKALQFAAGSSVPTSTVTFTFTSGNMGSGSGDAEVKLLIGNGVGKRLTPTKIMENGNFVGRWTQLNEVSARLAALADFSTRLLVKDPAGSIALDSIVGQTITRNVQPGDKHQILFKIVDANTGPNTSPWWVRFDTSIATAAFASRGNGPKKWDEAHGVQWFIDMLITVP
jgi:hypothetical protein